MDAGTRALTVEDILKLERIDGVFTKTVDVSPSRQQLAVVVTQGHADLDHAALPFLLGRDLGRLHLIDLNSDTATIVSAPDTVGYSSPLYSPDGRHLAVVAANVDGLTVGVIDLNTLDVSVYSGRQLLIDYQRQPPFQWLDSNTLVCQLLPANQRPISLEVTCHVRDIAPKAWTQAMGNRRPTASPLNIDDAIEAEGETVLLALLGNQLKVIAERESYQSAILAFEQRAPAGRTNEDALVDYYACEHLLWQCQGLMVQGWRSNQGGELRVREGDQPPRCLLKLNSHLQDVHTGSVMDLPYSLSDGRPGNVRCILPPSHATGQRHPALMFVYPRINRALDSRAHHLVQGPDLVYNAHLFAALGYVVLEPDLPFDSQLDGELIDALPKAVIPAIEVADQAGLIDRDNVQVFGQSAGGWAVMSLLATTSVFRSGISLAGVSDVLSCSTQPDMRFRYQATQTNMHSIRMGDRMLGIDEKPWQAPQRYVYNSPLYRVDAIQAPLLLMHGDLDYVDISQSEAMFMALKAEEKAVEFVRYWGEDHVYCSAANIRDAFERLTQWLARHAE